jgi:hypothetical protein
MNFRWGIPVEFTIINVIYIYIYIYIYTGVLVSP